MMGTQSGMRSKSRSKGKDEFKNASTTPQTTTKNLMLNLTQVSPAQKSGLAPDFEIGRMRKLEEFY